MKKLPSPSVFELDGKYNGRLVPALLALREKQVVDIDGIQFSVGLDSAIGGDIQLRISRKIDGVSEQIEALFKNSQLTGKVRMLNGGSFDNLVEALDAILKEAN